MQKSDKRGHLHSDEKRGLRLKALIYVKETQERKKTRGVWV